MKLEQGKWYKINNSWWGKVNEDFEASTSLYESVDSYGHYYSTHSTMYKEDQNNDFVLLTNLTEIEPYLPEGHPDKKFVLPDCWYIQLTEENQEDVIKWHKALPRGFGDVYNIHSYYGIQNNGKSDAWTNGHLPENSNVITYNQFKKYVLNQQEENFSYLDKLLSKWNIK